MSDAHENAHASALSRVDPRWDAARTERALTALHRRRARRRATTLLAAALLLGAGAGLGGWYAAHDAATPVAHAPRAPDSAEAPDAPATAHEERVVRLADGSRVVPDDGARVVVEHVTDELIAVRIDRGAAGVEVVPGLARRFEVSVGAITVTVLGTAFRVERIDETRAHVSVERGHVDVAWAAGHADLLAGDEGTFPTPEPATSAAPATAALAASAETTRTNDARRPGTAARGASPSSWRELARASRYDEAYEALGGDAQREREVSSADAVEDLLLGADVARLSGHPAEALPWLEAIERDHPADPRAVLASFTRGRLLMELGRPTEAARQLERVLAMEPSGSLAEDALARAALAHEAAGDHPSARAHAERYLERHPEGRWTRRIRPIATGPR